MGGIVVGFDGKDASRRALDRAVADAAETGATVVILVCESMPVDPTVPSMTSLDVLSVMEPPLSAEAPPPPPDLQALIDEATAVAEAAGVHVEAAWRVGEPGRAIVDAAREVGADRIVIGRDRHGMLGRLFGHDVQAEVERDAPCEVVVVD